MYRWIITPQAKNTEFECSVMKHSMKYLTPSTLAQQLGPEKPSVGGQSDCHRFSDKYISGSAANGKLFLQ